MGVMQKTHIIPTLDEINEKMEKCFWEQEE